MIKVGIAARDNEDSMSHSLLFSVGDGYPRKLWLSEYEPAA